MHTTDKQAETTILATLLFNHNISSEVTFLIMSSIKDEMFFDIKNKKLYQIFNETFKTNREIYNSKQFFELIIKKISFKNKNLIEHIFSIEEYCTVSSTIASYWLDKFHQIYFDYKYKNATSKKEFQEIVKEEDSFFLINNDTVDPGEDLKEYENRKQTAIFTQYKAINNCIGSLQGGDMIVLAAPTGGGKTCFMLNLALGFAKQGKEVDIYSLEMPPYQIRQRLICCEISIDVKKFRNFSLSEQDKEKYKTYVNNEFKKLKININKSQSILMDDIKRKTLKSKANIICIDYLGLISSNTNKNSYERFSDISREIKLLAMEANKPIIALHQLHRAFMDREDKKPRLSDLRDSGKIEQDADMVWFLYRPCLFDTKNQFPESDIRFVIAKNRHGETNKEIKLIFSGERQQILDINGFIYT